MVNMSRSLALLVFGVLSFSQAHAQLDPTEMAKAKASVLADRKELAASLKEGIAKGDEGCPKVEIPTAPVRTESAYYHLETALKARQKCVQAFETASSEPRIQTTIKRRYPGASPEQVHELVQMWQENFEPMRRHVLTSLQSTTAKATDAIRVYSFRRSMEKEITQEMGSCYQPYVNDWELQLEDAPTYLRLYDEYDACLIALYRSVAEWSAEDLMKEHFAKASDAARQQFLTDFPAMHKENKKRIQDKMDLATNLKQRLQAQEFFDSSGKTKPPRRRE